jgi:hypothetical protein
VPAGRVGSGRGTVGGSSRGWCGDGRRTLFAEVLRLLADCSETGADTTHLMVGVDQRLSGIMGQMRPERIGYARSRKVNIRSGA